MRVLFSKVANESYLDIIEFLSVMWTEREIEIFIRDVEQIVDELETNKFKKYQKFSEYTYSALIGKKHVRMFFRKENDNLIKVLLFFDVRQNPEKILELLK